MEQQLLRSCRQRLGSLFEERLEHFEHGGFLPSGPEVIDLVAEWGAVRSPVTNRERLVELVANLLAFRLPR